MSSNFFFPAVGRLNLLINVHLTFFFFQMVEFSLPLNFLCSARGFQDILFL